MAKRERSINWEKEEKQLLRIIIAPYLNIIENKDISTNTNKAKIKAWMEITDLFNKANHRVRDQKQIKNQWKTTKILCKKELSEHRKEIAQTGGGPKPPSPIQETLEELLIPQEFQVDHNEYDCDGKEDSKMEDFSSIKLSESQNIFQDEEINNTISTSIQDNSQSTSSASGSQYQPTIVPDPISLVTIPQPSFSWPAPSLETPKTLKKKRKLLDKTFHHETASYEDMHMFRVLDNERLQKEHDLRIMNMTEMHNQAMKNLKLQEEFFQKMLKRSNI